MKICPLCNLTYSDPTFIFCLEDGSVLSAPLEDEIETVFKPKMRETTDESQLRVAQIDDPVIAINIAQQYPNVKTPDDLYYCTRGLWRLNKNRAEKARYAFSVFKGIIREVYVIDYWEVGDLKSRKFWEDTLLSQGIEIKPGVNDGRFQFVGERASEDVREKYVGMKMPVLHAQNPIRYFNC